MGVLILKICALTFLSHDPLIIRVGSIIRVVKVVLDAEKKYFHFGNIDDLICFLRCYVNDGHNGSICAC